MDSLDLLLTTNLNSFTYKQKCSMSTSKCIKTFFRNTMTEYDQWTAYEFIIYIAIEKNPLGEMAKDPTFVECVIDEFAEKKIAKLNKCIKKSKALNTNM